MSGQRNHVGGWSTWSTTDEYRAWTWLAVVGVAVAVMMGAAGLPPVDLHGPLHRIGVMDPLCGGTRAARYTMLGHWRRAWQYNPLGLLAVLGAGLVVLRAAFGWLSSRWWTLAVPASASTRRLLIALALMGAVALDIRQQLIAPLLMAP